MKSFLETNFSSTFKIVCVIIIVACCSLPFLTKSFHIDDPLFIWAAKHIQTHPGDFYGFNVNWYGVDMPMSEITKNPPLASYYIAAISGIAGWSEPALHVAFFLMTVGAGLGMYVLANMFCSRPLEAVLAGVLTPVFLVSSTTLMCDMMMLCFWVWSIVLWVQGIRTHRMLKLITSAFLVAVCALTKYFGMNLILLLLVYTIAEQRRISRSLIVLMIPVILLGGYHWLTFNLYGRGLLFDAASYAMHIGILGSGNFSSALLIGPAFAGGCFITILFYAFRLWRSRGVLLGVILTILLILFLSLFDNIGNHRFPENTSAKLGVVIQSSLMIACGISLFALVIMDYFRHRDAASLLLVLWAIGTMLFATIINWGVNGRSFLPMVPAVGILMMRRIEQLNADKIPTTLWYSLRPLVPAACIALLVTFADYSLADTVKKAATDISAKYRGQTIWFQGHWGFQYYMESFGGKPLDFYRPKLSAGSIIVVPTNNTNIQPIPKNMGTLVETAEYDSFPWLTSMNNTVGAGFYSDVWGHLPYLFGPVPNERYFIVQIGHPEQR